MPEKRYVTMRHFDLRRKFVPITNFEKCIDLIDKEKKHSNHIVANIKQHNQENVWDAYELLEQMSKNYSNGYKELLTEIRDGSEVGKSEEIFIHEYSKLLEENINNLRTLKTFLEISLLENPIQELSHRIDGTASGVVQEFVPHNGPLDGKRGSNVDKCLQELEGMKSSWRWIENLLKCLIVHVRQASAYCQFHHDLHTTYEFISQFRKVMDIQRHYDDSYSSALRLAGEIQAAEVALKSLRDRVAKVAGSFQHVVPIHWRTQSSVERVDGVLICDYSTKEVDLKAGDEVTVVDRSSPYTWKVRTSSGVKVIMPSIIIIIPGHDDDSMKALRRLHEMTEEMIDWTVERMNSRLTAFLLRVFRKNYNKEEVQLICDLPAKTKKNLLNFFDTISGSLPQFKRSQEVKDLEARMTVIRGLIQTPHAVSKDNTAHDNGYGRCLVVQLNVLHYLQEMLQSLSYLVEERLTSLDFPKSTFKSSTFFWVHELDLKEELLDIEEVIVRIDEIICKSRPSGKVHESSSDNLKQQQQQHHQQQQQHHQHQQHQQHHKSESSVIFVNHLTDLSNFSRDLETHSKLYIQEVKIPSRRTFTVDEHLLSDEDFFDSVSDDKVPFQKLLWRRVNDASDSRSQVKISETEQFYAVESEENKKFVIKSVVDPWSKEDISLSDAIKRGVVDASAGTYLVCADPRETISISAAMYQNLIKVQSMTVRKSWEKKSSVGLVTVKTKTKNERKGWVESVFDFSTGSHLGLEEAEKRGMIDLTRGVLRDIRGRKEYTLEEAEARGWIGRTKVPREDEAPAESKVTYVVWGVLDRRREKMLAYHEACREGLMDRVTSSYYDLLSGKKYPIEEAIEKNFVKAEIVKDPKTLDLWRDA